MITGFYTVLVLAGVLLFAEGYAQEICHNGIDDDADGLIDLNDADCDCGGISFTINIPSLIPNNSFEEHTCCPNGNSQLYCAEGWIQASSASTDYWNTCGQTGNTLGIPPLPAPDGEGYVGFGNFLTMGVAVSKEYAGACLLSPMLADTTYNLQLNLAKSDFVAPFVLTIYGTPNCSDLPWQAGRTCPEGIGGWVELGNISIPDLTNTTTWQTYTITFTPNQDINAVAIGSSCTPAAFNEYYFLDNLVLNSIDHFVHLQLNSMGRWCDGNLILEVISDTTIGDFQWYRDGIALVGETSETLEVSNNNYGAGEYTIVLTIDGQCEELTVQVGNNPPAPVAILEIQGHCLSEPTYFIDQSYVDIGSITSWAWSFGDLTSSALQNPTHYYNQAGTYNVSLTVTTDSGCTSIYETVANIDNKPNAGFSASDSCLYGPIQFNNISQVEQPAIINSYSWSFDDANGSTSTLSAPEFNYDMAGSYNVGLIVETGDGCSDTVINNIDLNVVPVTDFAFDTVCSGIPTTFTNNSVITSGSINNYGWDFNPGTSTEVDPQYTFNTEGQYTIELLAISAQGCRDSVSYIVPVYTQPEANFVYNEVCFGDTNGFQDMSTVSVGFISQANWSFGDSFTSGSINPVHYYASAGLYDVILEVTTENGCTDDTLKQVTVSAMPEADFEVDSECFGIPVQITESSSISYGNIESWQWDFGDQNTFTGQNPPGHIYNVGGIYSITLVVGSGNNCRDTNTKYLEIYPNPVADFGYDNTCLDDIVYFTDQTIGADIDTWTWDFGNNISSALQNPNTIYTAPGIYDVKLQVASVNGCTDDTSHLVAINPVPLAEFTYTEVCEGNVSEFTDISTISSGNTAGWSWLFGDNSSSILQNPVHTYQEAGTYEVVLIVVSDSMCVDSIAESIEVYPLPIANFSTDVTDGCEPLEVNFIDQSVVSTGYIDNWQWNMDGKGAGLSGQSPTYIYSAPNTYTVSLVVETNHGCEDSIALTDMITVFPNPNAGFSVTPQLTDILYPWVKFWNGSSTDVIQWDWNFGDGASGVLQDEQHEYQEIGEYLVTQVVHNQFGCADTATDIAVIDQTFTFYIPNSFTPNGNKLNDGFSGNGMGIAKYTMRIFNRWGEQVFLTDDLNVKWDGIVVEGAEPAQNEVFVYRIEIEDILGETHIYNGHVTLVR